MAYTQISLTSLIQSSSAVCLPMPGRIRVGSSADITLTVRCLQKSDACRLTLAASIPSKKVVGRIVMAAVTCSMISSQSTDTIVERPHLLHVIISEFNGVCAISSNSQTATILKFMSKILEPCNFL